MFFIFYDDTPRLIADGEFENLDAAIKKASFLFGQIEGQSRYISFINIDLKRGYKIDQTGASEL